MDIKSVIPLIVVIIIIAWGLGIESQLSACKEKNSKLMEEISNLRHSLRELESEKEIIESELQQKTMKLKETQNKLNKTQEKIEEIKEEIQNIKNDISIYEEEIQEAIEWFKKNSILNISLVDHSTRQFLEERCIRNCEIKLPCLYLINSRNSYLGLEYKNDTEISNKTDKLQSIEEFLKNKGGDCEDFALFFKAELNYLLEKCKDGIKIETYYQDNNPWNNKPVYYVEFWNKWYIKDVDIISWKFKRPNVYVVCGKLEENATYGHCVIAINEDKDGNITEKLNNSVLIEAQTAEYIGRIGENIPLYTPKNENETKVGIWYIITNDDQWIYSEELRKWISYNTTLSRWKDLKERLDILLNQFR